MTRGFLFMTWRGHDDRAHATIDRAIQSVRDVHPDLPHEWIRMDHGSLLDKARMLELSPFDSTCFLDADTVVLEPLDFGFDMGERHGLACSICECPWARRFAGLRSYGDIVEYNTGVMFFTRKALPLFNCWRSHAGMDSSLVFMHGKERMTMPENDQAAFALAVHETGFNPFVLPMNWNFRPLWHTSLFGPLKVWHDYRPVTPDVLAWNAKQTGPDSIIEHARVA